MVDRSGVIRLPRRPQCDVVDGPNLLAHGLAGCCERGRRAPLRPTQLRYATKPMPSWPTSIRERSVVGIRRPCEIAAQRAEFTVDNVHKFAKPMPNQSGLSKVKKCSLISIR